MTRVQQNGSSGSTNNQYNDFSNGNVYNYGLSYNDVKNIAHDVCKTELEKYSEKAKEEIANKQDEFVEKLIEQIKSDEQILNKFIKPSIQYSLRNAEVSYIVDDSSDAKDFLVYCLKERIESQEKSLIQIASDEAIKTIPKLTNDCIDCLSYLFVQQLYKKELNSSQNIIEYINNLSKLYKDDYNNHYNIVSLKAANTLVSLDGTKYFLPLNEVIFKNFPGAFFKSITEEELKLIIKEEDLLNIQSIIIPNIWDATKVQLNAINMTTLEKKFKMINL